MRIAVTFEGVETRAHQQVREHLARFAREQIESRLPANAAGELVARVKRHERAPTRYSVSLRLRLPRKHLVVARGVAAELEPALHQAGDRLRARLEQQLARIRHQHEWRRRTRRARLRELKAALAVVPEDERKPLAESLAAAAARAEQTFARELAFLREAGDLAGDYPSARDLVDEAVARVLAAGRVRSGDPYLELLREGFRILDGELAASSRFGDMVSLESRPEPDAEDEAEEMVQEEFWEFYQPDEALHVEDILPDEEAPDPEAVVEAGERDFSLAMVAELPRRWRRVLLLAELDELSNDQIATVLEDEAERVAVLLERARAYLHERLAEAGLPVVAERPLAAALCQRPS